MKTASLLLFASCIILQAGPEVTAKREGTQVVFRAGEKEMFRYHAEPAPLPRPDIKPEFQRGGYLFPLLTPSGKGIADDYPANHVHHHGLWWAWTKTKYAGTEPDFWNMGEKKGRVEFVALDKVWEKDGAAGLTARHRFVSLLSTPPVTVLDETWELKATAVDGERPRFVLDFKTTQTCAGNEPLKLPKYHYGGLGFRGRGEWNGAENCLFLTSEGITDRVKVNTSTARWLWAGGTVDGATVGVTMLSHPENFRAPQPLRVHPSEPFICFAPQQAGEMEIKPGTPYVSRYRLVIADGVTKSEEAEAWWKEFAGK
jgi:Methane oxygenase PmoA